MLLLDVGIKALFERGMKVAALPQVYIRRCPKVVLSHQSLETSAWLLIPAFKFQGLVRCFCMMKHCTNLFEPSERIEPAEPANRKLSTINKIFHFRYK